MPVVGMRVWRHTARPVPANQSHHSARDNLSGCLTYRSRSVVPFLRSWALTSHAPECRLHPVGYVCDRLGTAENGRVLMQFRDRGSLIDDRARVASAFSVALVLLVLFALAAAGGVAQALPVQSSRSSEIIGLETDLSLR